MRSISALFFFVGVSLLVGLAGSAVTRGSLDTWYPALSKPGWTPPDEVFPIVWTALFVLMGIAAWRVWQAAGSRARTPLTLFAIQLVLNFAWSALFFGLRSPGAAVLEIFALIVAITATTAGFARFDRAAAWLMAPYLAWSSFAAVLNVTIWSMN